MDRHSSGNGRLLVRYSCPRVEVSVSNSSNMNNSPRAGGSLGRWLLPSLSEYTRIFSSTVAYEWVNVRHSWCFERKLVR